MPNRLGKAEGGGTSAKACRDSSQGRATVQPAPRSTARREMGNANFLVNRDNEAAPSAAKAAPLCNRFVRPKGRTLQIDFSSELVPAGAKAHLFLGRYGPTKVVP